ncbi:RHS repeat-associated core domain-containing protein [Nocardioides sp. R1-1]|uniref:RHS repeat-associated core domain-containing protein n=1 Tax=Nocardioides sp. R1-1 TaxID=3383502 RepID=UPI0038D0A6AB
MSADGKFDVKTETNVHYIVDIQGYFTAGQTAAGGFIPLLEPARVVDSRTGQGIPQAKLAPGTTTTVPIAGSGGIPADATAVFLNLTVVPNAGAPEGFVTAYAADLPRPASSLNYAASKPTAIGATVALAASGAHAGKIKVYAGGGGAQPIDILIDVVGYYTPPTEANGVAGFTTASARLASGLVVPAGQERPLVIAGVGGVPALGTGIDAVAANVQVVQPSQVDGHVEMWSDDLADTTTSLLNYSGAGIRSNFATLRIGDGGGVKIYNASTAPIQVYFDVQGWYSAPDAVVVGGQSVTSRAVALRASNVGAAAGRPWVRYQYKAPGDGYVEVPPAHATDANDQRPNQSTKPDGEWPVQASGSSFVTYTWDMRATLGAASSTKTVLVRACYGETATAPSTICGAPWSVTLSTGEFAYTTASAPLGPGSLSLSTGNFQLGAADASITTALGQLSVGRSLAAMSPNAMPDQTANSIFGPGWVADLSGPDAGAAGLTVDDDQAPAYLKFSTGDGSILVYQAVSPTSAYPITYTGTGDTGGDGTVVTRTSSTEIVMTDASGVRTTWTRPAPASEEDDPDWQIASVVELGAVATTTYRDPNQDGRIDRIVAPRGKGVASCEESVVDTTPGCRSLILTYDHPGGGADAGQRRLMKIELSAATTSGATNKTQIASFAYAGSEGRLVEAWNTQVEPALKTKYSYYASGDQVGRLKTIEPPGENPWTLVYDSEHRVSKLQRTVPVGNPVSGVTNQTATTTVVYGVPNSGNGLPSLTAAATATWGQTTSRPINGEATAIFPPSHEPAGTTPATVAEGDWKHATISYLGVNGRITNTAVNGAGGKWLVDSVQYTPQGATFWSLDARSRAHALAPSADTDSYVAGKAASAERADLLASLTVYDPLDPVKVTDTYGPTHPVQLPSGTTIHAREHTTTTYDQGAPHNNISPAGGPYRLPTTVKTAPYDVEANTDTGDVAAGAVSITRYGYDATGSMRDQTIAGTKWPEAPTGADVPLNGWNLGQATTTTTQMNNAASSSDLVTTMVYDAEGRVLEERLPGDTTGTTPRTTKTLYWGATNSATTCAGLKWAGLPCRTKAGTEYPSTAYTYNTYGQVTGTVENFTSLGPLRVTTLDYDAAGRLTKKAITTNAGAAQDLPNQTPVEPVTYAYSPTTGALLTETTGTGDSQKVLTTSYDAVGQIRSYTDSTGAVTYYGYDKSGRLASTVDPKGATTMSYGAIDEHRDLVTTKRAASAPTSTDTLGSSGSTDGGGHLDLAGASGVLTFTGSYNSGGGLVTQGLPGGLDATTTYDNAGNPISLTYTKGTATWATFTNTIGAFGRVTGAMNEVNGTIASTQDYTFDPAGRLTQVKDTLGAGSSAACTTRLYGFDNHSNRTTLTTRGPGADGACATSGGTTVTSTYDASDRITNQSNITNGTYTYDAAGRTLTVPGSDAQGTATHTTATGQLSVKYHANDMVASLDQGTGGDQQTTTFTLDPAGHRIATQATTVVADAPALPITTTMSNHYGGPGDSPSWSTSDDGTTTTWSRNVSGLGGLGVTVTGTGTSTTGTATVLIANLHGDIVATTPADGTASSITNYTETTEYGIPRDASSAKAPYGWHGADQRSADALGGLILMGVRLYNPASGSFLTPDPIPGGNATLYTYPRDPLNGSDLSGKWPNLCNEWCRGKVVSVGMKILDVALGAACAAATTLKVGCDILAGGISGGIRYLAEQLYVKKASVSWSGAGTAALNGALSSIGGGYFSSGVVKILKKILGLGTGKHMIETVKRKLGGVGLGVIAGYVWDMWNSFTTSLARRLA